MTPNQAPTITLGSKTYSEEDRGEASSQGPSSPKKDGKPAVYDEEEDAQRAFIQEMAQLWGWDEMTPEGRDHLVYMNQIAIFESIVGKRIPVSWNIVEALPPQEQERVCQVWGLGSLQEFYQWGMGPIIRSETTPLKGALKAKHNLRVKYCISIVSAKKK